MSTERFVQALFAQLGDWFADLPSTESQASGSDAACEEVRHG